VVLWELLTSQVPYHKIHYLTVAYSVAIKGCTLPIPTDCPALFTRLMQSCWQQVDTRPTFPQIIVDLVQFSPEFEKSRPESWADLQVGWRTEVMEQFEQLILTEEEMAKQQSELERIQTRQVPHLTSLGT
jgi:hypothetical protein